MFVVSHLTPLPSPLSYAADTCPDTQHEQAEKDVCGGDCEPKGRYRYVIAWLRYLAILEAKNYRRSPPTLPSKKRSYISPSPCFRALSSHNSTTFYNDRSTVFARPDHITWELPRGRALRIHDPLEGLERRCSVNYYARNVKEFFRPGLSVVLTLFYAKRGNSASSIDFALTCPFLKTLYW